MNKGLCHLGQVVVWIKILYLCIYFKENEKLRQELEILQDSLNKHEKLLRVIIIINKDDDIHK